MPAEDAFRSQAHGGDLVQVQAPAYRADIMHSWDIFEDAAKAFGYDKLEASSFPGR